MRQGHLDLHGCPRHVTWTRLAETAVVNSTNLTLQQEVDWVAGDRIVIAPTGKNGNETEVVIYMLYIYIKIVSCTPTVLYMLTKCPSRP